VTDHYLGIKGNKKGETIKKSNPDFRCFVIFAAMTETKKNLARKSGQDYESITAFCSPANSVDHLLMLLTRCSLFFSATCILRSRC
jgi:hypothetical protein